MDHIPLPPDRETNAPNHRPLYRIIFKWIPVGILFIVTLYLSGLGFLAQPRPQLCPEAVDEQSTVNLAKAKTIAPKGIASAFEGKWKSMHGDGTKLEIGQGKLIFFQDKKILFNCRYSDQSSFAPSLAVWREDSDGHRLSSGWPSRPFDWLIDAEAKSGILQISGIPDFTRFVSARIGIEEPSDQILKFERE